MKFVSLALAAAVVAVPAAAADTVTFNSTPADGWFYGAGNDYVPANTTVLTTDNGDQMYMRFHRTFQQAPASVGNVYSFALGTDPLSFDWGIDNNAGALISALLTLTNVGTGQSVSYNPFIFSQGNASANGSTQNSFRFNFIPGLFNPNVDNTYRVDMSVTGLGGGGTRDLSVLARFGAGAAAPAVPEPSTWAMLILGFFAMGATIRNRKTRTTVSYA